MTGFRIHDPLYGRIELPAFLLPVLRSAEVQRLRDVRLMNTASDHLSGLSDIRRFTHTVGATHLVSRWLLAEGAGWRLSEDEIRTVLVATVLHDVATPPFGHTVEYLLTVTCNWTHEDYLEYIVRGGYHTESRYHKVYFAERLGLWDALPAAGVDASDVFDLVLGRSKLGPLIAGTMDADNIDTAYRMGQALGLGRPEVGPELIMQSFELDSDGALHIASKWAPAIREWMSRRRAAYETFMFDAGYLLSQSLLSAACRRALSEEKLGYTDWFLTDEMLIRRLVEFGPTRELARRFALSHLPHMIYVGWYSGEPRDGDLRHPDLLAKVEEAMRAEFGTPVIVHVIRDAGSFEKTVTVRTPDGSDVLLGQRSTSTLVVASSLSKVSGSGLAARAAAVLEGFGLGRECLVDTPNRTRRKGHGEQLSLLGSP